MDVVELEQVVRNVDDRVRRIEQILPTLATKENVKAYARRANGLGSTSTRLPSLETKIQLIAEGQVALQERVDDFRNEYRGEVAPLDRRVTRLEAARGRRSPRTKPK